MDRREFFQQVSAGNIANVYLFQGTEAFVKESALNALRKKLLPEGLEALNEAILENASAVNIINAAETMPFMCEKRLVVARDFAPLMSGRAKQEQEEAERMLKWLANTPDTCCLVFYLRGSVDGRKKAAQQIVKLAENVVFNPLNDVELEKWLSTQASRAGMQIERAAMTQLVFMAGNSLTTLHAQMQKLMAYASERGIITVSDVQKIVTPSSESNVFQLIDCWFDGKKADAMRLMQQMLEGGETPIGILAMLTRQMRLLTHLKAMEAERISLGEIEKQLALNHFAAQRMQRQARAFRVEALREGYRLCVEADYSIKSGQSRDSDALYRLLFQMDDLQRNVSHQGSTGI